MKEREAIRMDGSMMTALVQMSEGNPGAASVLGMLMKDDPMAFMTVLSLDDMDIRGSQIWVGYKDHCKGDIEAFKKAINDRDPDMVATINASRGHAAGTPLAVTGGASFKRYP